MVLGLFSVFLLMFTLPNYKHVLGIQLEVQDCAYVDEMGLKFCNFIIIA